MDEEPAIRNKLLASQNFFWYADKLLWQDFALDEDVAAEKMFKKGLSVGFFFINFHHFLFI